MRLYAHDYVWGCQDRREFAPAPGATSLAWLIDHMRRALAAARAAETARRIGRPGPA
jgi:hypothetical protein